MADKIINAFWPIIDVIQGVSYPLAYIMIASGVLLMIAGSRRQGLKIAKLMVREAWETFNTFTEARQRQIAEPILARIDYLLDDDMLRNALCQMPLRAGGKPLIDFRRWADGDGVGPYCVLVRVPKSVLGEHATDALMTWLNTKLWLAVLTRADQPLEARRPCFAIYDEPHQFASIAGRAREQFVEGRKWRLGLVWSFHSWAQLDKELGRIIKAAGPHLLLFATSKEAWEDLREEIAPYTVEEALALPRFSALLRLTAGGGPVSPFLVRALRPPSRVRSRGSLRRHSYARPLETVERQILEREREMFR